MVYHLIVNNNNTILYVYYYIISRVYSLDRDIGTNGEISYSLTPDSSSEPFTIDSITGAITLTLSVSYSIANEWHNYTLVAMDGALGSGQRSTNSSQLAIRVSYDIYVTNAPVLLLDTKLVMYLHGLNI